jgi:S1-C subfamily serine protease
VTDGSEKKPKKPRKSRKTPVAGSSEAATDPVTPDPDASEPTATAPAPAPAEEVAAQPIEAARADVAPAAAAEPVPTAIAGTPPDEPPPALRLPRAASVKPGEQMPSPEWPLDTSEAENARPPEPVEPPPMPSASAFPDPKAAAFEAARIVGEMVGDIESAGGAAIVAAAAAGAAIEAARARNRAAAEGAAVAPGEPPPPAEADASTDPVTTVRMQRDRILRAIAEDSAAQAEAQAQGEAPAPAPERAPSQPGRAPSVPGRAPTHPGGRPSSPAIPRPTDTGVPEAATPEEPEEEFDPVQIAAAAIQRLRQRARTDLAELKTHYHRHDIFVLLLAFVIIVVTGRIHKGLVTPPTTTFSERGLVFEHSKAWLQPETVGESSPRIVHELATQPTKPSSLYHVEFTSSLDPSARLEVLIDKKPGWSNIVTGLELDRRTRWGELYTLDDSSVRSIAGHDWLRTAFRYAHVAEKGDVPRVDSAIEYATIDRDQIYVITLYGSPAELDRIEDVVAPSLRVPTQTGLPLVPQTRMLSERTYPNAVARAFDSTVMVVAADLVDGRLMPRGGGSGVVVGADGSILTNFHVIHDKDGRLHDVFVIGRFSSPDHAPQLWCAGRPSRSKLQRDLDLALIKCDLDLDGRGWLPTSGTVWATLPEARTADVRMGQRLWVLGYPDVGGGGLTLSEGQVEGWTGEDGTAGKDFIKTDASITHGNSGGPVVDDHGRLVGIAAAFRTRITPTGGVVETSQIGLVRPLSTASCLLAIATVGWTPRENHTDCDLEPSAVEAPAEGVRISSTTLDAASEAPVRDALVMILRPGVKASAVDVNRLDDQVLSWGRSNAQGEVQLKQPVPVPGTYTVVVIAKGYEPLMGEGELHLDANTPAFFDPWGKIWLRSR